MQKLTQQLVHWQTRERAYRIAWASARWFTIVLLAFAVCCFADWLIDRSVDTPFSVRVLMTLGQILLAIGLGWFLFSRLRVPSLDDLASKAEDELPEFDHRLVTSLQLNRPLAKTAGMSMQLLEACTLEAESLSARHRLPKLADVSRLEKAAMLLIPALLFATAFAAIRPTLTGVLLQRQCLLDVAIPRSVQIEHNSPALFPAGDALKLRFIVRGDYSPQSTGSVVISPNQQPNERYALKYDSQIDGDSALFIAELPPSSVPFTCKAWLHDGRTHESLRIEFAPRPVVTEVNAWLVLPQYVDAAAKSRFERYQPQGEVTTLPDCGLHLEIAGSKPVATAALILYSRPDGKNESVLTRMDMMLNDDKTRAEAFLPKIPAEAVAYRIELTDEHGFKNANPPRRGIASSNYQSPNVRLLPEVLKDPKETGPLEDFAVDGMPLVLEGQVQIGYAARSPLGISKVFIWYRVIQPDREAPWRPLPMTPVTPDLAKTGKFVPDLGVFENSGPFGSVECYMLPANDPSEPAGIEAGGRYNFQTKTLTKTLPNGSDAKLEVGDTVEFLVVAYDRRPGSEPGHSQSRIKAIVTQAQLDEWRSLNLQSRGRLEELFQKQRRVFQGKDSKP